MLKCYTMKSTIWVDNVDTASPPAPAPVVAIVVSCLVVVVILVFAFLVLLVLVAIPGLEEGLKVHFG